MSRAWRVLTARGRFFVVAGLVALLVAMVAGQRDVMRIALLLLILPVVAAVLVSRARLRLSCERSVEPAQVTLGSPMRGRITLGQDGRLPAGILMLEDQVPRELGPRPRFLVDKADLSWRREVEYPMLGRVRGRFATGPLRVRTTDPFGLVQLDRQFVATSEVMVTPQVFSLSAARASGGGGSTGEARPHRIGIVGQDDALVREYRRGDEVRRIHWRSTAHRGELMVRREEQAWDPSARLVLDSRARAHAGQGLQSSLEWAVSATASIALHFVAEGYNVEVFEADGPLNVPGSLGQHGTASADAVISRLTDLTPRATTSLHYAVETAVEDRPGQLVVAVLGRIDATDATALLRLQRNRAQCLALVLDVDSFASEPADARQRAERELAGRILRDNQWRVVDVPRGMSVPDAWAALENVGVAA